MPTIALYRNGFPAYKNGDEKRIFGKDADKVMEICQLLMRRYLFPHDYGYPNNPAIRGSRSPEYDSYPRMKAVRVWESEHPGEMTKYNASVKVWEAEDDKLLKTLFGIAARKHVRIEWCKGGGCSQPDRFLIYKNGDRIAMVQC